MEEPLILQRKRPHKNVGNDPSTSRTSRAPPWPTENTSKLKRDPFSAHWTTNDEDSAVVGESAAFPSAH